MSLSNNSRATIWLILSILSVVVLVIRTIDVITMARDWWDLVSSVIISALCFRFYFICRKKSED